MNGFFSKQKMNLMKLSIENLLKNFYFIVRLQVAT